MMMRPFTYFDIILLIYFYLRLRVSQRHVRSPLLDIV